jgi:hypothetical protein
MLHLKTKKVLKKYLSTVLNKNNILSLVWHSNCYISMPVIKLNGFERFSRRELSQKKDFEN